MPTTVQVTEGLFSPRAEQEISRALTNTILELDGVANNAMARRHLTSTILRIQEGNTYADGQPTAYVNVALRVPTYSLNTHKKRQALVTKLTDAIERLANGKLARDRLCINMLYGDGLLGVGGTALIDEQLFEVLESAKS